MMETMAKVTLNQLLEVVRGGLDGTVFRRRPDGTIIISAAPRYGERKATRKQKEHRERMKKAAEYASWADDVYPIYGQLAENSGKWLSAYNVALSDWFHAPVIHRIECRNGRILVQASDNVLVTKVQVTVFDEKGTVLEKGEAVRGEQDCWEFVSPVEGKRIVAEAWDLAKNVTRLELI